MSKSRLEKFLYALYSLDSSDLPTPLSRIEELYNCWVTGEEVSTFKPLSRVEKYLMAILGVYDVDSLPNPLSRVEVLLYKLATGDDNLDDVKSFLSEHEELLAEIIRNGGAGGNIDIEYVLYTLSTEFNTLYNTAEKPVKSAILKGQTLVNAAKIKTAPMLLSIQYSLTNMMIKGNTKYIFFFTHGGEDDNAFVLQEYKAEVGWIINHNISLSKLTPRQHYIFTTKEETRMLKVQNVSSTEFPCDNFIIIEYQEGMENWDIPYFEGMQSVKMPVLTTTGKNLFDINNVIQQDGIIVNGNSILISENKDYPDNIIYTFENAPTESVLSFELSSNDVQNPGGALASVWYEDGTNIWITTTKKVYVNTKKIIDIRIHNWCKGTHIFSNIQLEKGTTATPYEPYKSNILTVNEDVTLRSNGDACDELNLLTGRLTQRIDENNEVLAQEVVKTVDLSVVDQDGNDTELSTFNDITHVTLSSEGLIPEAELEVATKNEEVLNTMSLEMDDIFMAQTTLEETSNTQSENVDSTMLATTEIYEGLL